MLSYSVAGPETELRGPGHPRKRSQGPASTGCDSGPVESRAELIPRATLACPLCWACAMGWEKMPSVLGGRADGAAGGIRKGHQTVGISQATASCTGWPARAAWRVALFTSCAPQQPKQVSNACETTGSGSGSHTYLSPIILRSADRKSVWSMEVSRCGLRCGQGATAEKGPRFMVHWDHRKVRRWTFPASDNLTTSSSATKPALCTAE